jgi:hypothetical protein
MFKDVMMKRAYRPSTFEDKKRRRGERGAGDGRRVGMEVE